ncbi:hypothetical protein T484DRAFT_1880346 [Baffinella frigidus]|nr:hypothetical protein T484DRAFT_1880346 [Cryptophyta sp. CCMP2293]
MAVKHVPSRVPEVVTEVVDRLLALGRERKAVQLLIVAGYDKEALRVCIEHRLWTLAEQAAANLPPELVEQLRRARLEAGEGEATTFSPGSRREAPHDSAQRGKKKKKWGVKRLLGITSRAGDKEEGGEKGSRGRVVGCVRVVGGLLLGIVAAPFVGILFGARKLGKKGGWRKAREEFLRLRLAYPLLGLAQVFTMLILASPFLSEATFNAVSTTRGLTGTAEASEAIVTQPERNWTLPLIVARVMVAVASTMGLWILWERQRYYRQLVSSVHLMQVGALMTVTANICQFVHISQVLQFDFVVAASTPDGLYHVLRMLGITLISAGVRISVWDLIPFMASVSAGVVYFSAPDLALLVYFLQVPGAGLLAFNFFRAFQDMRLVLVPVGLCLVHAALSALLVVLCLVHAALSALLVATNNVAFHTLRDVLGDTAGWLLFGLSVRVVPKAIECNSF